MAATVNVEEIMNEIREDIQKKGYKKDQLSFEDFSAGATGLTRYGFDEKTALEILSDASRQWQLTSWKPLTGGKVKRFFKRCIRHCAYWLMDPVLMDQSNFNSSSVKMMDQFVSYVDLRNSETADMRKQISELQEEVNSLRKQLAEKN
ncbi:MAG: hypothetical protein LKG56_06555 [Lachnospiraceae bacterium]|jgi:hypothetical protein|nr:hypothetical protein [Lachnospiraceae bacterium]MCH4071021.1 hypothetical protein [Lachnospiraceae bacterium]MCH4108092.1 hypothetical protein [Lachnospiraceae bacterium]MCI1331937.1 hypothetical protein [Lachnospiraceae bacterium]MCI1360655.1 hypothetical protein [Lachnospiraceae bacterium]